MYEKLEKQLKELNELKALLNDYEQMFNEDGIITSEEQATFDKLNAKIKAAELQIKKIQKKIGSGDVENLDGLICSTDEVAMSFMPDEMNNVKIITQTIKETVDFYPIEIIISTSKNELKRTKASRKTNVSIYPENFSVDSRGLDKPKVIINVLGKSLDVNFAFKKLMNERSTDLESYLQETSISFEVALEVVPCKLELLLKWDETDPSDEGRIKGMQQMGGITGFAATFVMKYSGFGKLSRALTNHMEGKDPWTGEEGSTWRLALGGITDLLTMGLGGPSKGITSLKELVKVPAVTNILFNIGQEVIENAAPKQLEAIGLSREAFDLALSITSEENKYIKISEIVSNLLQAGLVSEEAIKKKFETDLKEEDIVSTQNK